MDRREFLETIALASMVRAPIGPATVMVDTQTGISLRVIRHWRPEFSSEFSRLDAIAAWPVLTPLPRAEGPA